MRVKYRANAFTIVELLIVIVVIAVLAAISFVVYGNMQEKARASKMQADVTNIYKAVIAARVQEGKAIRGITGGAYLTGGAGGPAATCISGMPQGTDLAALPRTHNCWRAYNHFLERISETSGMDIRGIVDPLGRPYLVLSLEREGDCRNDEISAYDVPFGGWRRYPGAVRVVPLSGTIASCSQ